MPFFSKNYKSSAVLDNNPGYFDVQIFPSQQGKIKFLKYLLRHTDYKHTDNSAVLNFILKEFRVVVLDHVDGANWVVDGESLKKNHVIAVQAKISDQFIYLLH
jgi:uncharacterized protein YpiB (UPF0302 family)